MNTQNPFRGSAPLALRDDPPKLLQERVGLGRVLLRLLATGWILGLALAAWVADRLFLRRLFSLFTARRYERLSSSRAVRQAFERLGPTYIKFGQVIASSKGLFPEGLCQEMRAVLDAVPPEPFSSTRKTVEEAFEGPLETLFDRFEQAPMAAASIAQVHGATLPCGTEVVVKVQRPDLPERVGADLWLMGVAARFAERLSYKARLGNLSGIVSDFAETLTEEMDFRLEGLNMDEFNAIFDPQEDKRVCAPRVYWERTRPLVLTMERFIGCHVDDVDRMLALPDPEAELLRGVLAWTESLLRTGMFHGDVHAGNLMYLDDGRIGFLDFGIVGRFDQTTREQSMEFLLCLATNNYRRFAEIVIEMSKGNIDGRTLNVEEVTEDLRNAYGPLTNMTMAEIDYGAALPNIQQAGMKHGLRMPKEFVLITKQFLYFDRYARSLAPNLNLFRDPRIAMQIMQILPQLEAAKNAPAVGPSRARPAAASR